MCLLIFQENCTEFFDNLHQEVTFTVHLPIVSVNADIKGIN